MKSYDATATSPTDLCTDWNSGVIRVEGRIVPGEIAAGRKKRAETGT